MPVEFLTQDQKERHGRFVDKPSPEELARHFHFDLGRIFKTEFVLQYMAEPQLGRRHGTNVSRL